MRKDRIFKKLIFLIGILVAIAAIFPLFWMAISGLKSEAEVLSIPFKFFPKKIIYMNYIDLLTNLTNVKMLGEVRLFPKGVSFGRSMLFSFGVASFTVIFGLFFNSMAAYVFARLEFPLKKQLWIYYLIPWFIPMISLYISTFTVAEKLGMIDTFWVLTIPGIANVFSIFFFRQFYLNVPISLEESALLDGAGRFKTYIYVFLPLSKTPFIVIGMFMFLAYWSGLLWPLMTISNPKLFMINQIVAYFRSGYRVQTQMIMAGATIAAIPTITLFLIFQRYITRGLKIAGIR